LIYDLAREVDAIIRAQGSPLGCVFGPERTDGNAARERVVLEHSPTGGDVFGPATSQHINPKSRFTRSVACQLRIYARSPLSGAAVQDHRRRAETVLDLVLVALDTRLRGTRRNAWTPDRGGFVSTDDLDGSQTWSGAVYELAFTVDRAVLAQTFTAGIAPESTLGEGGVTITSTTSVGLVNGPAGTPPETACGG